MNTELKDQDTIRNNHTGEVLTVLGDKCWNGSYEARSHTETYEFMGEQLPKIKRINPANYTVVGE